MSSKTSLFAESKKRAEQRSKKRKGSYIHGVKEELKKVTWTSKDELKTFTKVVILSTLLFGFGIFCVDMVARHFLVAINNLVTRIGS